MDRDSLLKNSESLSSENMKESKKKYLSSLDEKDEVAYNRSVNANIL